MNYWLTVHWPPRDDEDKQAVWWNWIFLAEGMEARGREIRPGDRVIVYETNTAPRVKVGRRFVSGRPGRKGVVAVATVRTPLQDEPNTKVEELEDGRTYCWRFRAKTNTDIEGLIPLNTVRSALKRPKFCARIPGGLMRLDLQQFNRILSKFH